MNRTTQSIWRHTFGSYTTFNRGCVSEEQVLETTASREREEEEEKEEEGTRIIVFLKN